MEGGQDTAPSKNISLPLQEKALAYGMLHSKLNAVTDYKVDQQGTRLHTINFGDQDFRILANKFRENPKEYLAMARNNLLSIMGDQRLTHAERSDRLSRYLDAYFDLQIKLDHEAFPSSEKVFQGIPDYIPDGLSDMGSDSSVEPDYRIGEKVRIDKKEIFKQSKDLFTSMFSYDFSAIPPQERDKRIKEFIAKSIGLYVYRALPYDHNNGAFPEKGKSILLSDYADKKLAVCKHQALYTQVLLQAFGLTSRLVKSDLSIDGGELGSHANNLVRINNKWFVLDVTNLEAISQQQTAIFFQPVKDTDIDLNKKTYMWIFANGFQARRYTTRSNMYYRIRDNTKDALG